MRKAHRSRKLGLKRSVAITSVLSLLIMYGQFVVATSANAAPYDGGLSPTIFGSKADLNGDGVVNGADDSNQFYGDTHIIDGSLDCNAWNPAGTNGNDATDTGDEGPAGDGVINGSDDCTLIGVDGSLNGVEIQVVNGSFITRDGAAIPNGTALPTVFNDGDPDNPSVLLSDFAWSTIDGRVDTGGDETIDGEDCHLGFIGQTVDAGLGDPHDGADVLATDGTGTNPCTGLVGPSAAGDDGLVDLNSDGNITFAGDTCNDGCVMGHNLREGVVQTTASPSTTVPTSSPFTGGFSPTIYGSRADLNGSGGVSGRDDANQFYGDTHIIDGMLDCDAWSTENDGAAGDNAITTADDCTLIGYDGTSDGVEITVVNGQFTLADSAPIADGTALPTVFNTAQPNSDIGDSEFAWSTINGRVDSSGNEVITADDCHFGLVGELVDSSLGDATDGADILGNDGSNACGFASAPAQADNGLVDLDSDSNITFAGDSCTNGCFFGHDVLEGVVQAVQSISISDVTVGENAGTAGFTVTLSAPTQSVVTVQYATADETATAPSDYTAQTGTVTFAANDTSETISVPIINDNVDEPNETFLVNLSNPTNATIADNQGQGTITDNDPAPAISIDDVTVPENGGPATFTVTLSNPSSSTVTVDYDTANGTATAGSDYTAQSDTLTFAPGDTTETINVPITDDALDEANETFFVNLSNPTNATIADNQGQGTITDNDPAPECPGFEGDPRNQIVGTAGDDVLTGTPGADIICGLGGNDTIKGGGGDDVLSGGSGNDRLEGGAGNDVLGGGSGDDTLIGGVGDDRLNGGVGNDLIRGGDGNDRARGWSGNDNVGGDAGNDVVLGDGGNDILAGGSGSDSLTGAGGNDRIFGGSGNDTISGGSGADRIAAESGNDRVSTRDSIRGNDAASGGTGFDRIRRDPGDSASGFEGTF